ncbi:hypothetical protein DUI87_15692 [Hirundo rustica rustica]|uniref:Uncharacterized protein n=1 Tax=Hirundo rustica rustica TaxID=333673 RepID=A0A3M0K1Q6_HIRRU|nr:hypothetical protein DUI87_15692 [Hirundo rustica rustica]
MLSAAMGQTAGEGLAEEVVSCRGDQPIAEVSCLLRRTFSLVFHTKAPEPGHQGDNEGRVKVMRVGLVPAGISGKEKVLLYPTLALRSGKLIKKLPSLRTKAEPYRPEPPCLARVQKEQGGSIVRGNPEPQIRGVMVEKAKRKEDSVHLKTPQGLSQVLFRDPSEYPRHHHADTGLQPNPALEGLLMAPSLPAALTSLGVTPLMLLGPAAASRD